MANPPQKLVTDQTIAQPKKRNHTHDVQQRVYPASFGMIDELAGKSQPMSQTDMLWVGDHSVDDITTGLRP